MNEQSRIQELVERTAAGRRPDLIGLVDQLFLVASEVGAVTCTRASDDGLCFRLRGLPPVEVKLDQAKSKLRMMCARLGVISKEQSGKDLSLYGDEAQFCYGPAPSPANCWRVQFKNTPSEQEFTIELA
jgi:hypothetical protein